MEKRAYIVDLLRGLAIVGMVLSGQIFRHAELPSWLFHAQTPPPSFAFNPLVAGITWVDLVFPFFLFSMGAAFPLAMRRRLDEQGESMASIVVSVVRRWGLLALFAISLANLRWGAMGDLQPEYKSIIQLIGWLFFCAIFMRLERLSARQNRILAIVGIVGLIGLISVERLFFGFDVGVQYSDIIILVLANMVLFGSLVWLATRNNLLARLGVLAFVIALRLGSGVEGSWCAALWSYSPIQWLFRFEYLKYLCIIIPGTIAGDAIYAWMRGDDKSNVDISRGRAQWALVLLLALFGVNMWGLFARELVANLLASLALGFGVWYLLRSGCSTLDRLHRLLFSWGLFWLVLGLVLEPFEGGIKKDYATFSYFFVTSGLASVVLIASSIAMRHFGLRFSVLVRCGQNPMVAYTAAGFVILPLLVLLQLSPGFQQIAEICPWMGFVRGVIVTAAVVAFTLFFTCRKLFWRT